MTTENEKINIKSAIIQKISIGLILGFVFACVASYFTYPYMAKTEDQRLLYLKQSVQIARNAIEPILEQYRDQNITSKDALEQVRALVRRMIYSDHIGKNYIFMSSYDGLMLVQPFEPEKELTNVWDLKDAYGVYIIRSLVNVAKSTEKEGYVSYHYQRLGETSPQEKISFVIGIPELGCYIGTGQYMGDIRKEQLTYTAKILGLSFVLLILLFFLVWATMKEIHAQNAKLYKTENELSAIFNNTFQFIGTLSPEGEVIKANNTALKLIEKNEIDIIGKGFWDTPWWSEADEETKDRLKKSIRDCSQGEFCRFEANHMVGKKGVIHVDVNLSPIFDEEGNVIWILAEGRDISEQIRIRDELIKEKTFFNYVIESLPGVFFLYKHEGGEFVMKKWNQFQNEKIFGFSSDDMKDSTMDKLIDEKDLPILNKAVEQIIKKGDVTTQLNAKTKKNDTFPILYQARYFEHSGERFIVGTGIELTEKIKAEEEKKRLEALLAQSRKMEAIGTLAGGIAHDFNNILSAILGFSELVKADLSPETSTMKKQEKVIQAAIRAKDLVHQILLFSRQTEQTMKPIRPELIIKEALNLLKSSIPTTIEIKNTIPSGLGKILADPTETHQIIMNLCTNSYHAMRDSVGTLTVTLSKREVLKEDLTYSDISLTPGVYLVLEVSDTGHGMDRDIMENIFDPYFTTKEKGEGTGLGLSVVHGIVKKCGGEIKVYSEPGEGTSFYIYFPKIDEGDSIDNDPIDHVIQTGSERILLVDDDEMIVDMTKESLSDLGYKVFPYTNSQKALDAFNADPDSFDLVITDMTMPKLTGFDLSKRILGIRPQMPIILCTGYSELITREKADAIGIKAFLLKPVLRGALSKTIREVMQPENLSNTMMT